MNRASLRNEGKIHLGLVYAGEPSLASARLMLDGALSFRRLIHELAGDTAAALATSTPFYYLVAAESLVGPTTLEERYAAIDALCQQRLRDDRALDYLGRRPRRLFRAKPLRQLRGRFCIEALQAAFATEELAIDTSVLACAIRGAIAAAPTIAFHPGHRVESIARTAGGFRVDGENHAGAWRCDTEQVVNCLWHEQMGIDAQLGLDAAPGWLHRLKYRVVARLPAALAGAPSATMVLGRYGDVVVRPDGSGYFSWYPLALRGWSHDLAPPDAWDAPCRGVVERAEAQALAAGMLAAVDRWYPGMAGATPIEVDAGVIIAHGRTDVDDPASGLHARTRIGVASVDGYHSVATGKLTTAPLFGVRAARRALSGDDAS